MNKHIHVTCAIIERDGLVMAAKRGAAMKMPHKWEFPGGYIRPGESPEFCLQQEIRCSSAYTLLIIGLRIKHMKRRIEPTNHRIDTDNEKRLTARESRE